MDWVGTIFVVVVLAVAAGLVLERRRRRTRLAGPAHSEAHRGGDSSRRARWQDEPRPPDPRLGGFDQ